MKKKVLIVEDQFVEANDLQLMLKKSGYYVCGIARSVEIARGMIKEEKPDFVLLDIFLKGKETGIDLAGQLQQENIAFIFLSANSNEDVLSQAKKTEPYGFIVKPFREKDLLVTLEIAQYRHEHSIESRSRREEDLIKRLVTVMYSGAELKERLFQTAKILQQDIPFDCLCVVFENAVTIPGHIICFLRVGFDEYQTLGVKELARITHSTTEELEKMLARFTPENRLGFFNNEAFERIAREPSLENKMIQSLDMKSMLSVLATVKEEGNCTFYFFSRRSDVYSALHLTLLRRIQEALIQEGGKTPRGAATSLKSSFKTIARSVKDLMDSPDNCFEGIIGNSHLLLKVFDQISQVAPFDTSVLILGETGTGKERIADCIHQLSVRKGKPLIKVNCAALPATLIESELFGHEKGSFTGATEKRIGKFEQANGGTIFLDEIGEMPVDLQAKLLRVLQEKEIEPIGGRSPVKIDVRFIAATHRHLEKEVADGRFRLDLYYRLNVFPIDLPSLRERSEDIPSLAQHFIAVYNRKAGKNITGLSDNVLQTMMTYHWPGNIREFEHLIERSVLLAKGTIIEEISLPMQQIKYGIAKSENFVMKTIHENERDYIINVLKKCNGRIWGAGGAAEILNVPPSTLKSKMKKLGIEKSEY